MNRKPTTPYEITHADRAVGVVVLLCLVLVVGAVVLHYQEIGPAEKTYPYYTMLARSYGIAKGGDISLSGISIGRIERVALQRGGQVRVDFVVSEDYREFVTVGSHLEVDYSIGLTTFIGGAGLSFVSNHETTAVIPASEFIETVPPVELSEFLNEKEVRNILANIKVLMQNLSDISQTFADNQRVISTALQNTEEATATLRDAVKTIPGMSDSVGTGFAAWERAGERVYRVVDDAGADIQALAGSARRSSESLDRTLVELRQLMGRANNVMADMQASASQIPPLISDGHALIRNANELTSRLNRHWLVGGAPQEPPRLYSPSIHPTGEALYQSPDTRPATPGKP